MLEGEGESETNLSFAWGIFQTHWNVSIEIPLITLVKYDEVL